MGPITIEELSDAEVLSAMARPYVRKFSENPRWLRSAFGGVLELLSSGGVGQVTQRLREKALGDQEEKDYSAWIAAHDTLTDDDNALIRQRIVSLPLKPLLSVVMPVCNPAPNQLRRAIDSILEQLYENWELCIANDASTGSSVAKILADYSSRDPRIKYVVCSTQGNIAATSNSALELVTGKLIALFDHADELSEHAFYHVIEELNAHPDSVLIYSDEDWLDQHGDRYNHHFKSDWNPDLFYSYNMVSHLSVFAAEFVKMVGGFRPTFEGAQDYDLALRVIEHTAPDKIRHIPRILYHRRATSGSPTLGRDQQGPGEAAARRAIQEHLQRTGIRATVVAGQIPGTHRVHYQVPSPPPLVSIIIPTRDGVELLRRCVTSIVEHTTYKNYEILIIDNNSTEKKTLAYLKTLEDKGTARVLRYPGPFNFSAINNAGVKVTQGELLAFLNNDLSVIDPEWLTEMVSHAVRPEIGAVGAKLYYPDGSIQHAGVVAGMGGVAGSPHRRSSPNHEGHFGSTRVIRCFSAVTGACMLVRRAEFDEVGGFNEAEFPVAFNDVDLCFRLRQRGLRVLWTPYAELYHYESASRGHDNTPEKQARLSIEADAMRRLHTAILLSDPYFNPNVSLDTETPTLAWPPRIERPWEVGSLRQADAPPGLARVAYMTYRLVKGYGVDVVVAEQIEYLCARGYRVTVLVLEKDDYYDGRLATYIASKQLQILRVRSVGEAVAKVEVMGADIAVAHTPPFHQALLQLPRSVYRVLFDHGEPPPDLFQDAENRRAIASQKVDVSRQVDLSVAISDFVSQDSGLANARLCRNGNDHLLRRRSNLASLVGRFRERHGLENEFLVLNVTRYLKEERRYKGVEEYSAVRESLFKVRPDLAGRVRFVIAGRAEPEDRAWAAERGLLAVSNLAEDDLLAAYMDADAYLSTSQWEGYNLGVAQALALGLPTWASARGAHPEFGIPTSNDPTELARLVAAAVNARGVDAMSVTARLRRTRSAATSPWRSSAARLEALIREGLGRRTSAAGTLVLPEAPRQLNLNGQAPEVSFIILNKDKPELIEPCVRSIEEHCGVPYEILIGDTGSTNSATLQFYEATPHQVHYLGFYNFSACNNILAARARGRHLLFLNNDTEIIEAQLDGAITFLAEHADVGCLGAYLVYPDHRIQHAGVRICPHPPYRGIPEHFDKHNPMDGYSGRDRPREVVAVTGAFMLLRRESFDRLDGFDEVYEEEAQDIDLCLRLRAQGLRSVVHPGLLAYHYENSTRTVKEAPRDRAEFLRRYGRLIEEELFDWQASAGLS
jgi:GT2 family glycosyltransferase